MSRVEYILGLWQPPQGHSVGINTIQKGAGYVLTGGRDGRVCGWLPNQPEPVVQYEAHTDWVNGLVETGDQIWSCSSDTTVKCYYDNQITTIGTHKDYVKCLSATSENIYSAGLDGQVISWSHDGQRQFSVSVDGDMGSIYSLAAHNNLFASGGPDSLVRLWDSRQNTQVRTFHGHGDNVRALLMNDEWIVSGSSDSTVRLWNLKAGRLFKTWDNYGDSVFSLYSNDNLHSWYSGDRQGKIYWTSREGHNILVAEQSDPVEGVVEMDGIWSGGQTCLKFWDDIGGDSVGGSHNVSPTRPEMTSPSMEVKPHVSLVKTLMLNDKRRVLVATTDGGAALIDIIRGEVIERVRDLDVENIAQDLEALAEDYTTQHVLDNWCQVSVRAGHMVVKLEERSAGSTEIYGDELGPAMGLDLGTHDEDYRVNLGKWVLQALFSNFVVAETPRMDQLREQVAKEQEKVAAEQRVAEANEPPKKERGKLSRFFSLRRSSRANDDAADKAASPAANASSAKTEKRETYAEVFQDAAELKEPVEQPPFSLSDDTRILISRSEPGQGAANIVFDSIVADTGTEKNVNSLHELLPVWVAEALWLPKMTSRTPVKIGFNVIPYDDAYPEILQNKGRLLANPILRANKAMAYAISSLKDAGYLQDVNGSPEEVVELYCKDELVPPLMTLAMVRTRMWKNGGDVQFKYKIKDPDVAAQVANAAAK